MSCQSPSIDQIPNTVLNTLTYIFWGVEMCYSILNLIADWFAVKGVKFDLLDLIFLGSFLNLAVSQVSRIYLTSESKQTFNQIIVFSLIWIICVYKMCCTELKLIQFYFHQMYYQLIFFDWKFQKCVRWLIIYCRHYSQLTEEALYDDMR